MPTSEYTFIVPIIHPQIQFTISEVKGNTYQACCEKFNHEIKGDFPSVSAGTLELPGY